jgi:hypothetical protein
VGRLPAAIVQAGKGDKRPANCRFVHAKVYRLWRSAQRIVDCRDIYFIGSPNLTRSAHQGGRGGNFETGMLVEVECSARPDWLLAELAGKKPKTFREASSEDEVDDSAGGAATLRYDWRTEQLEYYWDTSPNTTHDTARVSALGVHCFDITPVITGSWVTLRLRPKRHAPLPIPLRS